MQPSQRFYLLDVAPGAIESVVKLTHMNSLEQSMDPAFWLIVAIFLLIVGSSWTAVAKYNWRRLGRLERKIDLILTHLGLDPYQGVNLEVMELMKAGQKIQAIKLYREQTGVGLREAKEYVESL
jgi:hypothetical protein